MDEGSSALPDIAAIARGLLRTGRLIETEGLAAGSPAFDAGEANGLVTGSLSEGTVARGGQSLLIQGQVAGTEGRACTVQARDRVVIQGDVADAAISGREILIAGSARRCRLAAGVYLAITGDLEACRLAVGGFDEQRRQIEAANLKAQQAAQARVLLEQRLKVEEKRVDKVFRSTRFVCEFNLGQLIRRRSDRIQINLHPFYQVIGGRTGTEIDDALGEFFSRAVIGRLAHANKGYLQTNPNHEKVFTRVLGDLRGLFLLTRQLDRCTDERDAATEAVRQAVDTLRQQDPVVLLQGKISAGLDLQFVLPQVELPKGGQVSFGSVVVRMTVGAEAGTDGCPIKLIVPDGGESTAQVQPEDLSRLRFRVQDGQVVWEHLEPEQPA